MNGAARALLGGTLVAIVTSFPFVFHLSEALPGGAFDGPRQLALWLPWQIQANVAAGYGPFDGRSFPLVGQPLLGIVGNPGVAVLLAPLQALAAPVLAWNLGILLLAVSNAVGAWWLASTVRRGSPWLAALIVSGAWGWSQLGAGQAAVGWLAPGLMAAVASRRGHEKTAVVLGIVGGLTAPLPTAVCMVWLRRPVLFGLCLAAFVKFPPAGMAGELPGFTLASLSWLKAGGTVAVPLATLGLLALLAARKRAIFAAILALVLIAAAGSAKVGEYVVSWPTFECPRYVVAAVSLGAFLLALPYLRVRGPTALLVAAFLAVEPTIQTHLGQPALPWTGAVFKVPTVFSQFDPTRDGILLQLPFGGVTEGAVGWIPFHHRPITGGPGETEEGITRAAMRSAISRDPVFQAASLALESNEPVALRGGWDWAILYGDDTQSRRRARAVFGEPTTMEPGLWAWKLR